MKCSRLSRLAALLGAAVLALTAGAGRAAQELLYFVHPDHLNSPRLVADSARTTVWRWDQDEPFGASPPNEDPDGNSVTYVMPLRFPGQYLDKETNLHYNYFRDYDPAIGRYIQSDPIGLTGGFNPYAYVRSNPLRWSDRLGLQAAPTVPANPIRGAPGSGGGTWWDSQQRPRDPNGFQDQLFPEAGKKPGVKWPDWLRPWMTSESAEEQDVKQCPIPVPSDPKQPPGAGWEWRGKGQPGSEEGAWYNPGTGESMHPNLNHPVPIGPHWDYIDPTGKQWRVDPATGKMKPK